MKVAIAGTEYDVPEFTIEQMMMVFPFIMRRTGAVRNITTLAPSNSNDHVQAVYYGAVHVNNLALKLEDFKKLKVPYPSPRVFSGHSLEP